MSFPNIGRAVDGVLGAPAQVAAQVAGAAQLPNIDDWKSRPSAEHPRPVVLVHGTFGNALDYWITTAPVLAASGFTVFRLDYGALPGIPVLHGLDSIEKSAQQLAAFVDKVLASTGASKVDIVGHSQGGMMPRYYIKFLGGASKVNRLISLSPSNHGMAENELVTLAKQFPGAEKLIGSTMPPACADQTIGSALLTKLNGDGETVPGVQYTVIASKFDDVVTPYSSAFLNGPGVQNITLQDLYPVDISNHGAVAANPMVFREVVKHLNAPSTSTAAGASRA
ncbi:esterase/lipase family protein [Candidatus Protofrankia californiensis]|uniref:esterase/lipase family protein n=1 Tax=Candidatus Protofrankia californiensis TaxID=1839754 RepID=UPI00104109AF|nr:alpha/beta fold hydrolase [Candidatus Protofrankia californiensis]